ncbi:uncharacterized protein CLUP02_02846 [Colletotrichum lupini]|uniref:Uncharacterized protein n=1 Tax=Colletotrichum lupini TaxID=145971 RepID=A0A9Q8WB76_9PEZI|nr:uncharacterized protein CLUP02_02846 [Colletotrichum lupini]UQC77378.1 hypothetical protein CLUP02_02846 [Colletotrichum lupini]
MLKNAVSLPLTRPVRHPPSRASSDSPPPQRLRHCENKSKLWDMSIPPYLSTPDVNCLGGTRTIIEKFSRRPRAH